ncbi:alpha/beta fold hydrolase [Streptomyces sp. NPDC048111]|uniref:alpha/beta fold hydrolase n=1 Tax=Streptomyces sp. NPDC048111 TaxID=3365500 RepID=UPI00371ED706
MPTFTTSDGTRLAYHLKGEGEPLVCLPGGPMHAADYLQDLGGLADHRELVLLDPRGTGGSQMPNDPASYRCERQVADVEALRVHLGLDRLDLLAHSAAGNLALLYAARHPHRVRSLTLVAAGMRAVGIEVTEDDWRSAVALRAGEPWYERGRAAFERLWKGEATRREVGEAITPFAYGRWDEAARRHAALTEAAATPEAARAHYADGAFDPASTVAALRGLTAPVLVVAGAYDSGPTPAHAAELAALFPCAEVAVQRGAGHFPWVDDPGAFVRTVAAFLDPDVRSVVVDGVRLAYRVRGPEAAPPVVLVHGRGGDSRDWDVIAERLAATRRVYALDLRGHGLSDWPGTYSFEAFRDDLRGFMTQLGLRGAELVGHSMGGAAAALLAEDEPGLIGRLVLEETPPFFPLDPPRGPVEPPEGRLALDWAVITATNTQLNDPDPAWRRRFADITVPTLVVAGGPKSQIDQKQLAWMASRIPGARLVTIDAGHLVHTERPDAFLDALAAFGVG